MSSADVLVLSLSPELISYRESVRSEVQRERIQNVFCLFDADAENFGNVLRALAIEVDYLAR